MTKKRSVRCALSSILVTFGGERAFQWKNGELGWSILVGTSNDNVLKALYSLNSDKKNMYTHNRPIQVLLLFIFNALKIYL